VRDRERAREREMRIAVGRERVRESEDRVGDTVIEGGMTTL
jgi:hypothetical protein